jgi:hypothetical protein
MNPFVIAHALSESNGDTFSFLRSLLSFLSVVDAVEADCASLSVLCLCYCRYAPSH